MIGKTLAQFRIVEKIGEGGMGVVYKAEDQKLHRHVALKVLPPELVGDEERRLRFIREARLAAAVTHPNIAAVHQIDEEGDTVFIAMELVEGETLDQRIKAGRMETRSALRIAIQIAEGLAKAHGAGIVHRDLKPENAMVDASDHVKLLDFGLAKLFESDESHPSGASRLRTISTDITREGHITGTAAYMSPEQARGLSLDPRSDVFSFGVVLFKLVTGEVPFRGETITDILSSILRDEPQALAELNPEAPAELERIIRKCLHKDPADRYQHADEIAVDLRNLRRVSDTQSLPKVSLPSISSPSLSGIGAARGNRLRPLMMVAGALVVGAALVATLPSLLGLGSGRVVVPPSESNGLAVLPLANLKNAEDPERLGQILQELIITDLSGIDELKVFSSQRLFDIRKQIGGEKDLDREVATEVARRAGASAMMTGTLSQLGPKWILATQLVSVADGSVIKSERIDGEDLYSMVDELTGLLRSDLGLTDVTGSTLEMAVKDKTTGSIDAYQHYLAGMEHLNDPDYEAAVAELQKAVELDPTFGQARAKLALATWWFNPESQWWVTANVQSPEDMLKELLDGDVKLSERDRLEAEALRPLVARRYDEAGPLYEQLVRRYPDDKEAWYGYGEALYHGSPATRLEALDAFEKATALDPAFHLAFLHMLDVYADKRLFGRGVETVGRLIDESPDNATWYADWARLVIYEGDATAIDAAVKRVTDATTVPTERRHLFMELGDAFGDVGQIERWGHFLRQAAAVETAEDEDDLQLVLAAYHATLHQYDRQEVALRAALAANPFNPAALQALAGFLVEHHRLDEFIGMARGGLSTNPDYFPYAIGWMVGALARGDEAEIAEARAGIAKFAESEAAAKSIHLRAADMYSGVGNLVRAQEEVEQALALAPRDLAALFEQANLSLESRDYDTTLATASAIRDVDPGNNGSDFLELEVMIRRQQLDDALAWLATLSAENPDSLNWRFQTARVLLLAHRTDESSALIEENMPLLFSDLGRRNVLTGFGTLIGLGGDWQAAEAWIRRGLDLVSDPPSFGALQNLGIALARQSRLGEARVALEGALALRPFDSAGRLELARLELEAGRLDVAENLLRALLAETPMLRQAHGLLALVLSGAGRHEEAETSARRAVDMAPLRETGTVLSWVLVIGGTDLDEGIRVAEQARQMPPIPFMSDALPAYLPTPEHCLGLAYLKQGNFEQARDLLEQAAKRQPDRSLVQEHLRQAVSRSAAASP